MTEQAPCDSCGVYTSLVCPRDVHENVPLCRGCECAWVREVEAFHHLVSAPGTPYVRLYMAQWPKYLPPPKTKDRATTLNEAVALLDQILDRTCHQFQPIWDRSDALLAIAERAIRIHERDATVIDAWNEYVRKENAKRRKRRLRGWRNNYYSRILQEEEDD